MRARVDLVPRRTERAVKAHLLDVSAGGLSAATRAPFGLPPGTVVDLDIRLRDRVGTPDPMDFHGTAVVVRLEDGAGDFRVALQLIRPLALREPLTAFV